MRRIVLVLLVLVVTPPALYCLGSLVFGQPQVLELLFGPVQREPVDFATLQLKESPNQYLVCPQGECSATPHAAAPVFDSPAEELQQRWSDLMSTASRTTLVDSSSDGLQATYQTLTPLIGWPDSITVRFYDLGEGRSTLAIYSRSHYGYSDLGENRKRIERWLEQLSR